MDPNALSFTGNLVLKALPKIEVQFYGAKAPATDPK